MFDPRATYLRGARQGVLPAQNLARPAASARHDYADGFTTLVHLVPTRRRLQLKLLRRGGSRIESHILNLFRPGLANNQKVPAVVNSRRFTRGTTFVSWHA